MPSPTQSIVEQPSAVLERAPRRSPLGLVQICATGVLWGTSGLVVTVLHRDEGISAMTASAWRMVLGAIALVVFAFALRRMRQVLAVMRHHAGMVVTVGCGTAAYQGLYFVSVLYVGVSVATVISLGLAPIAAAVWEHVVARTVPSWREVVVLATALVGLVLITVTSGHGMSLPADGRRTLGLVLAVAAGVVFGLTTALGHTLAKRVDPIALTTCTTAAGAIVLAPFLLVAAHAGEPVLTGNPVAWLWLLYLGVATMALSYGLLYAGLRTTSGSAATIATLFEPLAAILLAVALLGERLTWIAVVGCVLIFGAVVALRPSEGPIAA